MQVVHRPFFSVIIPTYNRAKWIGKTVQSVLNQTFPYFEVIIIDDGSTDGTWEVLRRLSAKDARIRIVRNTQNRERAYSRNRGMDLAEGIFVTFLDSDDWMRPTCLEDAHSLIRQDPTIHFLHNRVMLCDARGRLLYRYPAPSLHNRFLAIMKGNFLSCTGVFIHREIYRDRNFRFDETPDLIYSEDYDLWIRVIAYYRLHRLNRFNTIVVAHEGQSATSQTAHTILQQAQIIYEKITADEYLHRIYAPYLQVYWSSRYLLATYFALEKGEVREGWRLLSRALWVYGGVLGDRRFWSLGIRLGVVGWRRVLGFRGLGKACTPFLTP